LEKVEYTYISNTYNFLWQLIFTSSRWWQFEK